jgi:hypothetical protein
MTSKYKDHSSPHHFAGADEGRTECLARLHHTDSKVGRLRAGWERALEEKGSKCAMYRRLTDAINLSLGILLGRARAAIRKIVHASSCEVKTWILTNS